MSGQRVTVHREDHEVDLPVAIGDAGIVCLDDVFTVNEGDH